MEFDINPNELSLQGPDGMQLVQLLRKLISAIDGGDTPAPVENTGIFYCTYGTTTGSQIAAAIADDLLPVCVYGNQYYYLISKEYNIYTFATFDKNLLLLKRIKCNVNTWNYSTTNLQEYLEFDYAPEEGSTNPVTSGGVWTAIQSAGGGSDIDPYQQYPSMDGTASPGSSDDYARGDHVHPTDTSRAAASEITRIDAALATKADQSSIEQTIEDTVDDWLTAQAPSIGTLSYGAKQALLACFRKVAWIDEYGRQYYNALELELFPDTSLSYITAVFTQGSAVIHDYDSLDTLRQYLTVTATYSSGTTETVSDYTLSGTLTGGVSTITVIFGGKTTTFDVTVTSSWVSNVLTLSSNNLVRNGIGTSYPYTINNTARVSYIGLDVNLSSAYQYSISYDTTRTETTQIAVRQLKASGYEKVQNHSTLTTNTDITDSGWQASGYSFTASDGSYLWFSFHTTSNATLAVTDFPEIRITRTGVS